MNYKIRSAEPGDIEELVTLCAEHAAYEKASFDPNGMAERLRIFLFQDQRFFCFVAVDDSDTLCGYATCMLEFSTWDAELYLHMDCLYLRPEARNRGIGDSFMRIIAAKAIELKCSQIQWQTPQWNIDAIRFYRRLGATSREKLRMYLNQETIGVLGQDPEGETA